MQCLAANYRAPAKTPLVVTAALEAAVGLALLFAPTLVVSVLLGAALDAPAATPVHFGIPNILAPGMEGINHEIRIASY